MVTRENVIFSPVRQLPVSTETGALHVSFEGGIRILSRGHSASCSLARGRSWLRVTRQFQIAGEPEVGAGGDLSVVATDMELLWSDLIMAQSKNLKTLKYDFIHKQMRQLGGSFLVLMSSFVSTFFDESGLTAPISRGLSQGPCYRACWFISVVYWPLVCIYAIYLLFHFSHWE